MSGRSVLNRKVLIWVGVSAAIIIPSVVAAGSPLLQWRQPVYIVAGFAGVVGLALLLLQPMLIGGMLPGLGARTARKAHGWIGAALVLAVALHVGGLWITSPPDVLDALLFRSPTPFSVWGVLAMWMVFAAALSALLRRRWRLKPRIWRLIHLVLAVFMALGTIIHALLVHGTMETYSKAALCFLVMVGIGKLLWDQKVWTLLRRGPR